jgi:hypothetical protein
VSAPLPAQLGGTNPFAHVLMMGGVALAALLLLRHISTDLSGRRAGGELWRQASSVAVGMGMTAAFGGAGTAVAQGLRGLRRRTDSHGESPPWERIEAQADVMYGSPQPGFDAVPVLDWAGIHSDGPQIPAAEGVMTSARASASVNGEPELATPRPDVCEPSAVTEALNDQTGRTNFTTGDARSVAGNQGFGPQSFETGGAVPSITDTGDCGSVRPPVSGPPRPPDDAPPESPFADTEPEI